MSLVYAGKEFVPDVPQEPRLERWRGIAFVYEGPGWVPGVPARDLTVEEAEELGWERVRGLVSMHTGQKMYLELPVNTTTD